MRPLLGEDSKGGEANDDAYRHWIAQLAHRDESPLEILAFAATLAANRPPEAWRFKGAKPGWKTLYESAPARPEWALSLIKGLSTLLDQTAADAVAQLRAHEEERLRQLRASGSLADDETIYRIKPREPRGWERLREWLQKHEGASLENRKGHVAELRTKPGRDFGGAELLQWLAAPAQQFLVSHTAGKARARRGSTTCSGFKLPRQ